jgi:hypothetical protein
MFRLNKNLFYLKMIKVLCLKRLEILICNSKRLGIKKFNLDKLI